METLKCLYCELGSFCKRNVRLAKIEAALKELDPNSCITKEAFCKFVPSICAGDVRVQLYEMLKKCCCALVNQLVHASDDLKSVQQSSGNRSRTVTVAFAMQRDIGGCISDLCMSAVYSNADGRSHTSQDACREKLLAMIDAFVTRAHSDEVAVLHDLQERIKPLLRAIQNATRMVQKGRPLMAIAKFFVQNMAQVECAVRRICTDPWFRLTQEVAGTTFLRLLQNILNTTIPDPPYDESVFVEATQLASQLHALLSSKGEAFVSAISADIARIESVVAQPVDSDVWKGILVSMHSHTSDSDHRLVPVQAPSFAPSWQNSTRHLYVGNTQNEESRSLMACRVTEVLRRLVVSDWLPVESIRVAYLIQAIQRTQNQIALRTTDVATQISSHFSNLGIGGWDVEGVVRRALKKEAAPVQNEDAADLREFEGCLVVAIDMIKQQEQRGLFSLFPKENEAFDQEGESSQSSQSSQPSKPSQPLISPSVRVFSSWCSVYLVLPNGFDVSDEILTDRVHPWVKMEYLFVVALFRLLRSRVVSSDPTNPEKTIFETSVIAAEAASLDGKYASMQLTKLSSKVTHVMNKFFASFKAGHRVSQQAMCDRLLPNGSVPNMTMCTAHEQKVQVGEDTNDHIAYLCVEALFRVKLYLESGSPMPSGMVWVVSPPHRGVKAKQIK
jgi:hypothetical protein